MRELIIKYMLEVYNATDEEYRDEFRWTPASLVEMSDVDLLDAYVNLVSFEG